jgi:phosphoglycerate dehydrogenase-like enzyme
MPVAEYAFAQIVLASKGFFQRLHVQADGSDWPNRSVPAEFPGNYEITVGIVGAGMIGKMVIGRLHTLDKVKILVFDPFLPDEKAKELGVIKTDLRTLFRESDVISNHLANNPQTVGMLNGALFSSMKPHAVFINTGRGAQVSEYALAMSLLRHPSHTFVGDVLKHEYFPYISPLFFCPNAVLTPHIAGSTGNEGQRMAYYMAEELERYLKNEPAKYEVTAQMLERLA